MVHSLSTTWYRYVERGFAVLAGAGEPRAGAGAARHLLAEGG